MVVVDELHMIGSGPRGALLEVLLAKIRMANPDIKIIGMSATIKNIDQLATVGVVNLRNTSFPFA
jgi:helicase